ncbi:DUF6882 domain-containing protein [Williamsia sp. SKLECPSW1]
MGDLPGHFWIDQERDVVAQLADHTAVLSGEAQEMFAERYGHAAWDASLGDPVSFVFHTDPPTFFAPCFLGSRAEDGSWMWGWNNINGFADPVVAIAHSVYQCGDHLSVDEFRIPLQHTDPRLREADGLPVRADCETTFLLAAQALSLDPAPAYFRVMGDSDESRSYLLLRNDDEFALPPATAMSVQHALTAALAAGTMTDHALAVFAYADRRAGVTIDDPGDQHYTLHTADGSVTVSFDGQGRIARIESRSGG